jgi:DNA invertase Pin-like site-specific DNA recombinase
MKYGYARVSSAGQNLDEQIDKLTAAGCEIIRSEKVSGTSRANRTELATLLDFLRPGDELWITRIDRLARSVRDLADIVADLKARGVTLRATEQPIDASTAAGQAFLSMLGVFAEFETAIRADRQREGVEAAKRRGAYVGKGRPARIDAAAINARLDAGERPADVARALGISRATVYRLMTPEP